MKKLTTAELKRWRDEKSEDFALFNVLPHQSFEDKRIPGSISAPVGADDFVEQVEQTVAGDKSKSVVVYCANKSCNASPDAARKLEQAGFTNVFDYEAGIEAWESAGHEVATAATR